MLRSTLYWTGQASTWGGLFALGLVFQVLGGRAVTPAVVPMATVSVVGFVVTHLIRTWIQSHRWLDHSGVSIAFRSAVAALMVGLAVATTGTVATSRVGTTAPTSHDFLWLTLLGSVVGLAWVAFYLGASSFERLELSRRQASELEAASREAELSALKAQLDPHFMFNSLNAIRSLIEENPGRARDAVTHLAGLMRYATTATRASEVSLDQEMATVRSYLELEGIRFEERLETAVEVDLSLGSFLVPPLVVQTLVENGIKHGIAKSPDGGRISVKTCPSEGGLRLEVRSTGRLRETASARGVGLQNLRQRLELLYGEAASLDLLQIENEVVASVVLPTGGNRVS